MTNSLIEPAPEQPVRREFYKTHRSGIPPRAPRCAVRLSARTAAGAPSLNDCRHPGPALQRKQWNVLAADLANNTRDALECFLVSTTVCSTDSSVALHWFRSNGIYRQFVANGVEIRANRPEPSRTGRSWQRSHLWPLVELTELATECLANQSCDLTKSRVHSGSDDNPRSAGIDDRAERSWGSGWAARPSRSPEDSANRCLDHKADKQLPLPRDQKYRGITRHTRVTDKQHCGSNEFKPELWVRQNSRMDDCSLSDCSASSNDLFWRRLEAGTWPVRSWAKLFRTWRPSSTVVHYPSWKKTCSCRTWGRQPYCFSAPVICLNENLAEKTQICANKSSTCRHLRAHCGSTVDTGIHGNPERATSWQSQRQICIPADCRCGFRAKRREE